MVDPGHRVEPCEGRHGSARAGCDQDPLRAERPVAHAHGARVDERRLARDGEVAAVLEAPQPGLLRADQTVLAFLQPGEIEAGVADLDAEVVGHAEVAQEPSRSDVVLRGLAGHVRALPAPALALDHCDGRAVVGRRPCCGLARSGTGAEHDQVEPLNRGHERAVATAPPVLHLRLAGTGARSSVETMSSREAGTGYAAPPADARIVEALRSGDELAFVALVEEHVPSMLRVARLYVSTHAVAEEVVQEAWVGVLRGIVRFEGRSSLKTWIFRILTNTAKTRGEREGRSVPFSSLAEPGDEGYVDLDRFTPEGRWAVAAGPRSWHGVPEERLVAAETMDRIRAAIEALPDTQRTVITLRDVEGWSSEEVCNVLELTETNQRVLLHRARSRVRNALEAYIAQEEQQ